MMWRSAYHRVSDDSVSSFGGHPSEEAAVAEGRGRGDGSPRLTAPFLSCRRSGKIAA